MLTFLALLALGQEKRQGGENRRKYVKRGAYLSKAVTGCEDPEGEQSKTKL